MIQIIPQRYAEEASVTLTEKDLYCITRMLQGSFCKHEPFFCCHAHCEYRWECAESLQQAHTIHFYTVRQKLNDLTGVWINTLEDTEPTNKSPDSR